MGSKTDDLTRSKARNPASFHARFPSLARWETPWEQTRDLAALRAKAADIRHIVCLARKQQGPAISPTIKRVAIESVLAKLELPEAQREQLLSDANLIADFHALPAARQALRLSLERTTAMLRQAAELAHQLSDIIDTDGRGIEALIQSLPGSALPSADDLDVLQLGLDARTLATAADAVRQLIITPGRRSEVQRNHELALVIEAVELATGSRVRTSRGNSQNEQPHFKADGGAFVRDYMALLGHRDERVLVRAAEEISRTPKRTTTTP